MKAAAVALTLLGMTLGLLGAEPAPSPNLTTETLPNGLRVTIHEVPEDPVVATQVWYHVGSANEEPESRGFAHLFEHLMFKGSRNYPGDEYASFHTSRGGYENAYTSFDETVYISAIAPEYHRRVLEMEADRMVNLTLTDENLENEKRIVTEELRRGTENDPMDRILTAALKAVFGEHPYAHTAIGTKEDIAAANLDQCKEFYGRYYRPGNAHLVVVGPVDAGETLEAVREVFGAIEPRNVQPPVEVPAVTDWEFPEEIELSDDLPPVEIAALGFPLPPADSEDTWALLILRHLLAGGEVMPFAEELVRRRRKAVYAEAMHFEGRRGGMVVFLAGYLPYRRKATAFRLMEEALQKQARFEWLTEETLRSAKRSLVLMELNETYFASSQAGSIGRVAWWNGDDRLGLERAPRIEAVTLEEVRNAYRRYIGEAKPVRLYVKPEKVPLLVRLFGWLYPLVNR